MIIDVYNEGNKNEELRFNGPAGFLIMKRTASGYDISACREQPAAQHFSAVHRWSVVNSSPSFEAAFRICHRAVASDEAFAGLVEVAA